MNKNIFFMLIVALVTLPACSFFKKKDVVAKTTCCERSHTEAKEIIEQE